MDGWLGRCVCVCVRLCACLAVLAYYLARAIDGRDAIAEGGLIDDIVHRTVLDQVLDDACMAFTSGKVEERDSPGVACVEQGVRGVYAVGWVREEASGGGGDACGVSVCVRVSSST